MKKRLLSKAPLFALIFTAAFLAAAVFVFPAPAFAAADIPFLPGVGLDPGASADPNVSININGAGADTVRVLLLLTVISLVPSILLLMTCFTRIIVTFSLLRNAIGLQQTPPNQVLVGLALFLSLFIMAPVLQEVATEAYVPFSEGEISSQEFLDRAETPMKEFMLQQTLRDDLDLFVGLSRVEIPDDPMDYPLTTVVPAFVTSELKRAFLIGFFLFIPFLIIDMVVSSALMSMGMMMLPPATISLPFKLMLFVLVDGWGMLIRTLVAMYRV